MKKTVLTFGLISGALSTLMMWATLPFIDTIGMDKGVIVGYTAIVVSFLMVFFGIRSYRDNVAGGEISFGRAFKVGILITFISSVCYIISWQIMYFNFMPDFFDKMVNHAVEGLRASGATQQRIDQEIQSMKYFKELYDNPLFNAAITFIEPFPVGLIVTLVSSLILRKKERSAKPGAMNIDQISV